MSEKILILAEEYYKRAVVEEAKGNLEDAKYYYIQAAKMFYESSKYAPSELAQVRLNKALECERAIKRLNHVFPEEEYDEENSRDRKVYEEIESNIKLEDVKGLEDVKERIREALIYPDRYPDLYKVYGISRGGRILMYGPPGCGKTYIARACGGEIGVPIITTNASLLLSKWVGEAEKNISYLFQVVKEKIETEYGKIVLFIDEIDSLGTSRSKVSSSTVARRVVTQFLTEIDNLPEGVLLIAATNHPWDLDAALLRSGRFGTPLFIPPPDFNARVELFKMCMENTPGSDNIDYELLASRTELYSGADIAAENGICETAKRLAFKEATYYGEVVPVTMEHFNRVLENGLVKPSILNWIIEAQGKLKRNRWLEEFFSEMVRFVNDYLQNIENRNR